MRYIIILLSALTFISCDYLQNIDADSNIISKKLSLGKITTITADAPCEITLLDNSTDTIYINGYEHLIDGLSLNVTNNTLVISHTDKYLIQKSKLIKIELSASHLESITANMPIELFTPKPITCNALNIIINGTATFSETDISINCQALYFYVYGNNNLGNFFVDGKTETSHFNLEGAVNITANHLESKSVVVVQKSIGNCWVNALETLTVNTYSTGNTLYTGNPQINQSVTPLPYYKATGQVINNNK